MLDKKMQEALNLLGGRAVIKDQENYYILLTLSEFKKIKQEGTQGLTKQELVDRINSDIASWKFSQDDDGIDGINLDEIEKADEEMIYEKSV